MKARKVRLVDLWEVTHSTCLSRERFQGFWRMCSINIQGQCWSFVHRDYVFTQPRSVRVSLLYLSGFCVLFLWPRCGQCCEYRVGLFIDTFLLFTSLHAEAREREVRSVSPVVTDQVLSPATLYRIHAPSHFPCEHMRLENPKWKSGPVLVLQEMRLLRQIR